MVYAFPDNIISGDVITTIIIVLCVCVVLVAKV